MSRSLCESLAAYFQAHSNEWVDARQLLSIAGFAGWRTRISDLRKPPFSMEIQNRVYKQVNLAGERYTVSEYKFVAPVKANQPALDFSGASA
jgi:hypothetical protein